VLTGARQSTTIGSPSASETWRRPMWKISALSSMLMRPKKSGISGSSVSCSIRRASAASSASALIGSPA
jgi:hypothetical protein